VMKRTPDIDLRIIFLSAIWITDHIYMLVFSGQKPEVRVSGRSMVVSIGKKID
jgi:hypothetical protein